MSEPYSDNRMAAIGAHREPTPDEYERVLDLIGRQSRDHHDEQALIDAIFGPRTPTSPPGGEQ